MITGGWDIFPQTGNRVVSTEVYPPNSECNPASLPSWRQLHDTFITQGPEPSVVTCGGIGSEMMEDCDMLNPATGQWDEAQNGKLSNKRYGSLAVTLASHGTYMLGGPGFDQKSELLTPGSTTWTEGPTLPIRAYGGCAVPVSEDSFILSMAIP